MEEEKRIKLNLGSGTSIKSDYVNIDARAVEGVNLVADVSKLPYEDNSVDEVLNRNLIEHFGRHEITNILKEWARVLKPGGLLETETVEMGRTMDNWKNIPEENLLDAVLGAQTYPENFHKMLFTEDSLRRFLKDSGFEVTEVIHNVVREIPRITIKATKLYERA